MKVIERKFRPLLLSTAILLAASVPLSAQEPDSLGGASGTVAVAAGAVSPEAQAVLDRMTRSLRDLQTFSIDTHASRDEVVSLGYKLQNNEHSTIVVQRPNKLRAEISGDVRNRTIVYDGANLTMYSPDDAAYVRTTAPDTLSELIGTLLDLGVEMPSIDVLYQGTGGTLTEGVRGGIVVGSTKIDGVECDHLAFRQADIDWQLWVEKGARALPRKILITTRYEHGEPQYEATLDWNLKPQVGASTFAFNPPSGATEIPLANPPAVAGDAP